MENIWNKAKNLLLLKKGWFRVPDFFVLSWDDIKKLNTDFDENISEILKNIESNFNYKRYSIRSSSSFEDRENSSMAWQFKSFININKTDIGASINQILIDAFEKSGNLDSFSIMVQEYVPVSMSGVTFTRDPLWFEKMILEYHYWEGEELVSWKIIPKRFSLNWNEENIDIFWKETCSIIDTFKDIERFFSFPMDVEWCFYDSKLYILQARKITNIDKNKYESILFFQKLISGLKDYYFLKNEVSEICPNPVTFSYDLLKNIYAKDWPIDSFYKKNKIEIWNIDFLKIIWNNLYVDKQKELKNFFPSLSYFKSKENKIRFESFKGLLRTIKNLVFLKFINLDFWKLELEAIRKLQLEFGSSIHIWDIIDRFLTDYELIYSLNYLSSKAFNKLENILRNEKLSFSEAMSLDLDMDFKKIDFDERDFLWNSLDISDESKFYTNINNKNKTKNTKGNFLDLPKRKRDFLTGYIKKAKKAQYLRELSRLLTVKYISLLRKNLLDIWESYFKEDKRLIFFATISEIRSWEIDKNEILNRKQNYDKNKSLDFPTSLSSFESISSKTKNIWISSWIWKWTLVELKDLDKTSWDKVLFVDILSPDLVAYFDRVNAILSKSGWILSHLSIIAREKWLPVVVLSDSNDYKDLLWKQIELNWDNGLVRILEII